MIPLELFTLLSSIPFEFFTLLAQFDFEGQRGLIGTVVLVLDIVAIVSVLMGGGSIGHKVLWILLILLLPVVGMILYFIFGRNPRDV